MMPRLKHGHVRSGHRSPEYSSWQSAIARCYNPAAPNYQYYGYRGIGMCDRWRRDFAAFLEDMGPRPDGTTLDRIDPHGNYEPGNCRWATPTTQIRNRARRGQKLTLETVREIERTKGAWSSRRVAAMFGISHTNVQQIWRGEIWRDA